MVLAGNKAKRLLSVNHITKTIHHHHHHHHHHKFVDFVSTLSEERFVPQIFLFN